MLKLYKTIDGVLHYHEAWVSDDTLTEHWGRVGEEGESRSFPVVEGIREEDSILQVLKAAAEDGYRPVDIEDHRTLLIEYAVVGMGTKADLAKRHSLEDRMNQTLGWTGLGFCDGGSIGSGSMEVCCYVVDFEVARRVIATNLVDTEFSGYRRIYDENAG